MASRAPDGREARAGGATLLEAACIAVLAVLLGAGLLELAGLRSAPVVRLSVAPGGGE
ncbi:MAG TPA: hypothetical protein VGK20_11965 [Candidatus Binatia bacterium]|jgi:hypothetical protein